LSASKILTSALFQLVFFSNWKHYSQVAQVC